MLTPLQLSTQISSFLWPKLRPVPTTLYLPNKPQWTEPLLSQEQNHWKSLYMAFRPNFNFIYIIKKYNLKLSPLKTLLFSKLWCAVYKNTPPKLRGTRIRSICIITWTRALSCFFHLKPSLLPACHVMYPDYHLQVSLIKEWASSRIGFHSTDSPWRRPVILDPVYRESRCTSHRAAKPLPIHYLLKGRHVSPLSQNRSQCNFFF